MVLHYNMKTIMRNGYEFPEKKKTSHFFFENLKSDPSVFQCIFVMDHLCLIKGPGDSDGYFGMDGLCQIKCR
jgi:hypothetical protein